MGLDFIYRIPSKPWEKGWNGGVNLLKQPDLFTIQIDNVGRVLQLELHAGIQVSVGTECSLQLNGAAIDVYDGHRRLGQIASPPSTMLAAIANAQGVAAAVVERLDTFGVTADLRIL